MKSSIGVSDETRRLLRIALPLTAAYLSEFAMFVTTKLVVGDLGYESLAAVGIAGNLSFEILVIEMGLLSIVGVLCAQAEGAGERRKAGLSVRQGFIVSLLIGLPTTVLIWHFDKVLALTGQDPVVVELSKPFVRALCGFTLPVLFFAVLRNYVSALIRPTSIMFITVGAVVVNYFLTVLLVYGGLGIPALGLAGAGLSLNIVSWGMFGLLMWFVFRTPALRGYGLFAERWRYDPVLVREILVLGLPVAGLVFLEAGLFTAASILSGIIGAETLAAYEIVMSWVGIPFVIALGVAEATMLRVAHGVGAGQRQNARQSGLLGIAMGVTVLIVMTVIPVAFGEQLVALFITEGDPGYALVSTLATSFLVVAAVFQVFDGLQAVASRALRGFRDIVAPLWIASFGYWVLGIGGGALLAFGLNFGGIGLWWGMAAGLTVTALLLTWRFHSLSGRPLARESA